MSALYQNDFVDHDVRREELSKLPSIQIRTDELAKWRKFNDLLSDAVLLDTFTLINSQLFIRNKKGDSIIAAMDDLHVIFFFDVPRNTREAIIEYGNSKLVVKEVPALMSEDGWDVVFESLRLAGSTVNQKFIDREYRAKEVADYKTYKRTKTAVSIANHLFG